MILKGLSLKRKEYLDLWVTRNFLKPVDKNTKINNMKPPTS